MDAFWIILTGSLVASSCALLGCYLVLRKMAMVGDAISHAVLPGIFLAYMLAGTRSSVPLLIGAAVFGVLCTFLIELLTKRMRMQNDAAIGLTFTFLFAIGVILATRFASYAHLDQDCILYGEIAYVPFDVGWTLDIGGAIGVLEIPVAIGILSALLVGVIALIWWAYKPLFITTFDPAYAAAIGISTTFWHYVLMGTVSLTTVLSFESVGAILVVAFLIGPAATAYLLTDRLPVMLILAVLIGILSAILGYWLAVWINGSIAGAMATVVGGLFGLALFFSPSYGIIGKHWRKAELS